MVKNTYNLLKYFYISKQIYFICTVIANNRIRAYNNVLESETTADKLLLFRKDIMPSWEDSHNCIGGNFSLEMNRLNGAAMDSIWKRILMLLIGGSWKFTKYINGIRYVDRLKKHKIVKIEIWTTLGRKNEDWSDEERNQIKDDFRTNFNVLVRDIYDFDQEEIIFNEHFKKNN